MFEKNKNKTSTELLKEIVIKVVIFLIVVFTLRNCDIGEKKGKEKSTNKENVETKEENIKKDTSNNEKNKDNILKFVDITGEECETTINKNLKMHNYDLSKLSRIEKFYQYTDENVKTKVGIDVSKYQSLIDWEKVKASGVEFAIIRLGRRGYEQGVLELDERYLANIKDATEVGLDVGVFFSSQAINEKEAIEEATFVKSNLGEYDLKYGITYFIEYPSENCRVKKLNMDEITNNAIAFCNKVKEYNYDTMICTNMYWEANLLDMEKIQENDIKIWYVDYENEPQTPYDFEMWRYTEKGNIDGINADVDINLYFAK